MESMETKPALVIGVICNGFNQADINYYENEFRLIRKIFGERVRVIFIGTDGAELPPETEYTKPVSINHYFRHLYELKMDLLFIPLTPGIYNETSEETNKFREMALFGVPVITLKQFPYSAKIIDKRTGFLYDSRETFIDYLKELLENHLPEVKMAGLRAYEWVKMNEDFDYEPPTPEPEPAK
jgi:hypothetical protein